ncbi:MAG: site-specific integrase [Saprospiraceae bacterium]|nr:site-specific integrase [Saprospiraceae bacterium]
MHSFIAYLRVEKKYSPKTCISYQNDLSQFTLFVKNQFESDDILHIRHTVVRAWIVDLMSSNFTATTVNRKISALRSFFHWAIKKKHTSINPMLKITAPKKPKRLPEVVPETNIKRLLKLPGGYRFQMTLFSHQRPVYGRTCTQPVCVGRTGKPQL